jgi:RNA polymerase sigma-70 factor (ECF subfamily)
MNARTFQVLHNGCRDRVHSGILAYVRNLTEADEVTAMAFATAFEKRKSFRGEASFFTWVYRIALNQAHSSHRRKSPVSLDAMDGLTPRALIQPDLMDSAIDRANCCRQIRTALRRIPTKYRRAIVDHFVRGYSTKEIARLHRIPVGTVLSRIFTGKRLLRRAWEALHERKE